jgi:hypothetical protein
MNSKTVIRVTVAGSTTPQMVDRYLYGNYGITGYDPDQGWLWIEGQDHAGFTADAIVDRLSSGLIWAAVVERPAHNGMNEDRDVPRFGGDPAEVDY